jgi:glucose/mannose-6-phosphate isomerase
MLDDIEFILKIDKSGMFDTLENFPEQIRDAINIADSTELNSLFKIDNIIISGMGGSAISGDIIKSLFRNKFNIPIFVNRSYDLPKWANKNTLVISQSYSGNTEETLSTFKHAYQKKCKIIGISSGGKLQEYCINRSVSHIKIPSGYVPRAATAYMLFLPIMTLKKIGLLKNNIELEIEETLEIVDSFIKSNKKVIPEQDNLSKQIARKIFNTIPQVYGWKIYNPIAKRWCTQFNENSKIIARYDIVSECNHNDIVGWSQNPEFSKKFSCILFRDKKSESYHISTRLDFMKSLFKDVAANVIDIEIINKKTLTKMIYSMILGDFVSCYLAVLRGIDPTPVDIIVELKNILAKI